MDLLTGSEAFRLVSYSCTLLIVMTIMAYSLIQTRLDKTQNKIYLLTVGIVFLNAAAEIVTVPAKRMLGVSENAYSILLLSHSFYYLLHTLLCPMFGYYVICVTGKLTKYTKKMYVVCALPYLVCELFVLTNPALHLVFYYDENMEYCRGPASTVIYAVAGVYFIHAAANIFVSWNGITKQRRASLIYFFVLITAGIIVQLIFVDIKCELFAEAVALFGVMLTIENEDSRLDADTGIYNRNAVKMDIDSYVTSKQEFYVLCIKITNSEIIQRVTGSANTDTYIKMIGEYLKTLAPRYNIYHVNPMTYAILYMGSKMSDAEGDAYRILERFESPWKLNDSEVVLKITAVLADMPGTISGKGQLLYIADNPPPPSQVNNILKGEDLNYFIRRIRVERAVTRGLEEHNFEVFYQPTYYIDDLSLHGAEALLRLHDPELGNVFPDEFISAAERMGLIDDLDDYVLAEVCRFIKTGFPSEMGLDSINVNLSVLQCMRPGFVERILKIVEGIGADKSMINFEITESVSASDYHPLIAVVKSLKDSGFMFSMDDYGTGFSNMQSIFSIDFDIVKIDKSILWAAEKSEMGMIILENSVRMINQMGRRILVEGVETSDQIELLRSLGRSRIDYLQGFYFSKPVPKSEFVELIKKQNHAAVMRLSE